MSSATRYKQVITVDGPSGSGKSTVSRKLAKRLGFVHLNSGALFRAVGLETRRKSVSVDDDEAVAQVGRVLHFSFVLDRSGETHFLVDGIERGAELLSAEAAELASRVAVLPKLRQILVEVQREAARVSPLVVEGRDAGTVVFPDAAFKFYLDAAPDVRAKRRFEELTKLRSDVTLEHVKQDMMVRDHRDSTREVAPLCYQEGTIRIDTSAMDVDEVVEALRGVILKTA